MSEIDWKKVAVAVQRWVEECCACNTHAALTPTEAAALDQAVIEDKEAS